MTTVEVAAELGVAPKTARRWAQAILRGRIARPRGGGEVELRTARRDASGFYYLSASEIRSIDPSDLA